MHSFRLMSFRVNQVVFGWRDIDILGEISQFDGQDAELEKI